MKLSKIFKIVILQFRFIKKRNLLYSLFILAFAGFCLAADRNERNYNVKLDQSNINEAFIENEFQKKIGKVNITIKEFNPKSTIFSDIFSNFIIDNNEASFKFLNRNYIIAYVIIENNNEEEYTIKTNSLLYNNLTPIHPNDFPGKIHCINWKGNIKNLYNFSVFSATLGFVIGAFAICAKEGKCEALKHTDTVLKISTSGETDPQKSFSNPIFTSHLKFEEVLNSTEEKIPPKSSKKGILVYERPLLSFNKNKAFNFANCIVE